MAPPCSPGLTCTVQQAAAFTEVPGIASNRMPAGEIVRVVTGQSFSASFGRFFELCLKNMSEYDKTVPPEAARGTWLLNRDWHLL